MRLRNHVMLGALAIAFGAAFAFGGHGSGEPKTDPVRAEALAVSRQVPAIPALPLGETLPALAKPAAHPHRTKRRRAGDATPAQPRLTEPHADPAPGSPPAARPPAPRQRRRTSPAPTEGDSGADSTDDGAVTPAATPAPVQVTPAPVEPQPDEEADPEEEEAG